AESPLAHCAGGIACFLENLGKGACFGRNGILPFGKLAKLRVACDSQVGAHLSVAAMLASEQDAAGRGADWRAAIVSSESHPFGGQPIDIGRGNLLLPITANLAPAKIVGHD